jgi:tetratricopeptide (TPR) repeat protein
MAPAATDPPPPDLSDALRQRLAPLRELLHGSIPNAVVPFVGSGLSRGLKSWTALLDELVNFLPQAEQAEAREVLAQGKHVDVAGLLEGSPSAGPARIQTAIVRAFKAPNEPAPPIYAEVAGLPTRHFITTNFDPWLKNAVGRRLDQTPNVLLPSDAAALGHLDGKGAWVFHLHGDADKPDTCVLTASAYRSLLSGTPAWRHAVQSLLSTRHLLFLGTSLSEPHLDVLLGEFEQTFQAIGGLRRHWWLGRPANVVERRRLERLGIEVVDYGDHALLSPILAWLAQPDPTASRTPRHAPPPTPATGPRSNLPPPAPFFGRADALEKIARWLDPSDRSWGVHIDGPGGIGKSALALEAAHRAPAERYPLKLWVTAKTRELHPEGERKLEGRHPGDFTAILDAFARALDRDDLPRLTPEDRPAALHAALAAHRALLVVDNLEALAPAERRRVLDWLNRLPQSCRALVTSRRRDDSLAGHALQVDKLDRAAADQLLAALGERQPPVARLTAGERERLYNETGGNPLLLTWIAAQLGRTTGRCRTVDAAVARLHDADRRAHEAGNDPLAYVFGDLVESFTPDETKVLAALAHFTRPASVDWLLPMTDLSRRAAETALDGLRDRALLIEDEAAGTWLLPPLAAGYLRRVRPEAVGQAGTRLANEVYALVQENGWGQHDRFPLLDAAWPRVEAALLVLLTGDNRRLQAVCNALGTFLDYTGRWDERLALSEAAEARALAAGDLDSAGWRAHDAGFCHNRRGQAAPVLAAAGRAAAHWRLAGDPARERAIAIRLRGLGHELADERDAALAAGEEVLALFRARDPGRADVALALNDVARRLHWLGRHDEAEARYREALALARRVGYVEGVATYTANLAELALDRGRPAEAEALACEALALAGPLGRRDFIGDCCTHLARALAAQGRGVEGRPHAERAVDLLATLRAPKLLNAQAALAACVAPPAPPRPD